MYLSLRCNSQPMCHNLPYLPTNSHPSTRITLPALIAATNNAPPRTKIKIILINSSVILEPTCMRVVIKARNQLGRRLYFTETNSTFLEHADFTHDLLFFARLDTDDSFGPGTVSPSVWNTYSLSTHYYHRLSSPTISLSYPCHFPHSHRCIARDTPSIPTEPIASSHSLPILR